MTPLQASKTWALLGKVYLIRFEKDSHDVGREEKAPFIEQIET